MKTQLIEEAYRIARERYAAVGVDTDEALEKLQRVSLSLHCWQADDVTGFENRGGELTGGIQATGNYPGKARNVEELRADILKAASYIPGTHRLNLHEIYGEFGGEKVDRNEVEVKHFAGWIEWAPTARSSTSTPRRSRTPRAARFRSQPRSRDPRVLDRAHQALPRHRRSDGRGAGHPVS